MNEETSIISSFRRAHQSILRAIDQVMLVIRDASQAQRCLADFKEVVSAHLGRQNQAFYHSLDLRCSGQREKMKMSEFLFYDVKETKIKFLEFIEIHGPDGQPAGARHLIRDFHDFRETLINRIKIEEEYLLPLLDPGDAVPDDKQKSAPLLGQENLL